MEYQAIETSAATIAAPYVTFERAAIYPALDLIAKRINEKRNTIAVLANILIEATGDGMARLIATDLDIQIAVTVSAQWEVPGRFTVDAAILRDIVKKADTNATISMRFDDGERSPFNLTPASARLIVRSGRIEQRLPVISPDDFPIFPVREISGMFEAPAGFIDDLAMVAPFTSRDYDRYWLNGVAIQAIGGALYCVATDGETMSSLTYDLPDGADSMATSIIPSKAIAVLRALAKMTGETAPIVEISNNRASFELGAAIITTKLIDGEYPEWRDHAPTGELSSLMLPELDARLANGKVEALKKAISAPLYWEMGDVDGAPRALVTSPSHPHWQAVLCGTLKPVYPQGYTTDDSLTVEADGVVYPVATKSGRIHLSKETVHALCGPVDPSTHVYIPVKTWWRMKCVAIDGVPTADMPAGYRLNAVTPKGKERYPIIIKMLDGEIAAPHKAIEAQQDETPIQMAQEPETSPCANPAQDLEQSKELQDWQAINAARIIETAAIEPEALPDPLAAITARIEQLETALELVASFNPSGAIEKLEPLPHDPRMLSIVRAKQEISMDAYSDNMDGMHDSAPLSVQSKPKRTAAHIRAIMAYLAMRKQRVAAKFMLRLRTDTLENANRSIQYWRDLNDGESRRANEANRKRRRAVIAARVRSKATWQLGNALMSTDKQRETALAESERLRKVAYQQAGHIVSVAERLDRAEAILRGQGAWPTLAVVPPISLAVAA